jgi:hypothetical protein
VIFEGVGAGVLLTYDVTAKQKNHGCLIFRLGAGR